jgi:hypothetical protein
MALRFNPKRVDVVEIDPVLVRIGRTMHPEKPYADARVHTENDDARAFLRQASGTWDVIVMNALDSHHQLPGLSTLRLESFICTAFLLQYTLGLRLTFAAIWIGVPIFFAALIFSHSFRDVSDTASAFGANLLGVVVGGTVEYSSMVWGLNSLYIATAAMYLGVLGVDWWVRRAPAGKRAALALSES